MRSDRALRYWSREPPLRRCLPIHTQILDCPLHSAKRRCKRSERTNAPSICVPFPWSCLLVENPWPAAKDLDWTVTSPGSHPRRYYHSTETHNLGQRLG